MKFQRLVAVSLLSLPASGFAASSTATSTLNVTATVENACTVTAGSLAFGSYDPKAAVATDQSSTLKVTCTPNTPYTITMGLGAGANGNDRHMKSTASSSNSKLQYGLFRDEARVKSWGSTNLTGVSGTGDGTEQQVPVYGRIPTGQWVAPGAYQDDVTVTLSVDNVN